MGNTDEAKGRMKEAAGNLEFEEAARLRDGRHPFVTQAAMCKIFASEVAERVASLCVNLYGGYRTDCAVRSTPGYRPPRQ